MCSETELGAAIEELASEARPLHGTDYFAPPDRHGRGRLRTVAAAALIVTIVIAVGALAVLLRGGDRGAPAATQPPCQQRQALGEAECLLALRLAHRQAARPGFGPRPSARAGTWPPSVRIVAAHIRAGTVSQPNVGPACSSGRILAIQLIGSFPHMLIGGGPGLPRPGQDPTVHAVLVDADPATGRPCLVGVQVGRIRVPAGSAILFRRH